MKTPESVDSRAVPNGKRQLNVVFHGLWAWEATGKNLFAHTPIEPEHQILVGDFTEQLEIPKDTNCVLDGVDAGQNNSFLEKLNLIVPDQSLAPDPKRHCVIQLPLPADVRSVRTVPVKTDQPFDGDDGKNLRPNAVSMVQVFIYELDHLDSVTLKPLTPPLRIKLGEQTANLHFFAQPPKGHHQSIEDSKAAYRKMAAMFGLDVTPVEALFVGVSDPNIPGMTEDDLRLLGEDMFMAPAPHPHGRGFALPRPMFESGSNCDGLVIDNRGVNASRGYQQLKSL